MYIHVLIHVCIRTQVLMKPARLSSKPVFDFARLFALLSIAASVASLPQRPHTHTYIYVYLWRYRYVHILCMYVCMCVCIGRGLRQRLRAYIYIYIYIYTQYNIYIYLYIYIYVYGHCQLIMYIFMNSLFNKLIM